MAEKIGSIRVLMTSLKRILILALAFKPQLLDVLVPFQGKATDSRGRMRRDESKGILCYRISSSAWILPAALIALNAAAKSIQPFDLFSQRYP
jgi:hypothetical protein